METKKTAVVLATVATMAVAPGAAFAAGVLRPMAPLQRTVLRTTSRLRKPLA